MREIPIIITGGGSVGLTLAAELGWRGISCFVAEKSSVLNQHPRANAVANRTMEYYRDGGLLKQSLTPEFRPIISQITTGYQACMEENCIAFRSHLIRKSRKSMTRPAMSKKSIPGHPI